MKRLSIQQLTTLLKLLTASSLATNKELAHRKSPLVRLKICPKCMEVGVGDTCAHQKEMH